MAEMRSPIQGGIDQARRTFSASSSLGSGSVSAYNSAVAENNVSTQLLQENQATLQQIGFSLSRVSSQMEQLNNNFINISNLVTQSSTLENLKEQQKNKQERMLAEQQLREGKESIIERKLQNVLQKPVQKIGAKAQFALSGLMNFFNQLFFGWLLYQGIETIKALSEGNTEKLEEIKTNVIENLKKVGSVLFLLNGGFLTIIGALTRVGSLIFRIVRLGFLSKPIKWLWNSLNSIGKRLAKILPPAVKRLIRLGANTADDAARAVGSPAALGGLALTGAGAYFGYRENVESGMEPAQAATAAGVATGAGVVASTFMKGPWWLKALGGAFAYSAVNDAFKGNLDLGIPNIFGSNNAQGADDSQMTMDQKREFKAVEQPANGSKTEQMKAAEVSSAPRVDTTSKIGPEPEPAPTVAFLPATPAAQQQSVPAKLGMANRIPFVSPTNDDNFHLRLFSQTQYQVV